MTVSPEPNVEQTNLSRPPSAALRMVVEIQHLCSISKRDQDQSMEWTVPTECRAEPLEWQGSGKG